MTIKDLKKVKEGNNTYFKLINSKGVISKTIYYLNGYVRELKKYSISNVNDVCSERFIKPTQEIFIDFEY